MHDVRSASSTTTIFVPSPLSFLSLSLSFLCSLPPLSFPSLFPLSGNLRDDERAQQFPFHMCQ